MGNLADEYLKTKYLRKSDQCAYRNCKNARTQGNRLYGFPQNSNSRLKTWIKNAGNPRLLYWKCTTIQRAGFCLDHFKPEDFFNNTRQRLLRSAVPIPFNMQKERSLENNTDVNSIQEGSLNNLGFDNNEIESSTGRDVMSRLSIAGAKPVYKNYDVNKKEHQTVSEQDELIRKFVVLQKKN